MMCSVRGSATLRRMSRPEVPVRPTGAGSGWSLWHCSDSRVGCDANGENISSIGWSTTVLPDVAELRGFLDRASRRLAWMRAAEGASAGLVVAIMLAAIGWPAPATLTRQIAVAVGCVVAGIAARAVLSSRRRTPIAAA